MKHGIRLMLILSAALLCSMQAKTESEQELQLSGEKKYWVYSQIVLSEIYHAVKTDSSFDETTSKLELLLDQWQQEMFAQDSYRLLGEIHQLLTYWNGQTDTLNSGQLVALIDEASFALHDEHSLGGGNQAPPKQGQICPAMAEAVFSEEQLGFTPRPSFSCQDAQSITWMNYYGAYVDAQEARGMLRYYDQLLAEYNLDREAYWFLASDLNYMRGEIFYFAFSAYILGGPVVLPEKLADLPAALATYPAVPQGDQYPATLDELIELGILPHLPASPYPNEAWVDRFPAEPVQPGTVYYRALPTTGDRGVILDEPGGLENAALFIFGEMDLAVDPEMIRMLFPGDGYQLEGSLGETIPKGIIYVEGIYRNNGDKVEQVVIDKYEYEGNSAPLE